MFFPKWSIFLGGGGGGGLNDYYKYRNIHLQTTALNSIIEVYRKPTHVYRISHVEIINIYAKQNSIS